MSIEQLSKRVEALLDGALLNVSHRLGELTCEVRPERIKEVCEKLRDNADTRFEMLIDLCGVDYSEYGANGGQPWQGESFAVVYHLLSISHNNRIRLRAEVSEDDPRIDSVIDVWRGADWFEREAFDLFGILFVGHPDLRRLLTDYGFIGHPFRKAFPLSGEVEMRYDEKQGRVIYEPVTVEPRVLVPRVIREELPNG